MQMPFGKYKGQDVEDIPEDYLRWVLRNVDLRNPNLRAAVEEIVGEESPFPETPGWGGARANFGGGASGTTSPPRPGIDVELLTRDLIDAVNKWRREMAKAHHPDRGGSTAVMQAVNRARTC